MSVAKAQQVLLERLGSSATVLLAVLLDLPGMPAWADGTDAEGRSVVLVGRHALGTEAVAGQAVAKVMDVLRDGAVPDGVCAVAYAPAASAAIAEVVAGAGKEVLIHGPRGSGKTQATPAALAILAEWHARGGYRLPLEVIWLHDSLTNAAMKTAKSLGQPQWAGLWTIHDNSRVAKLHVGGTHYIEGNFIGTQDPASADRTRAECHVVAAEEMIPSLNESGGIPMEEYSQGVSSMRLPTGRHVATSTTNPGAPETWLYQRFLAPGHDVRCVPCFVPREDRMTPEEIADLEYAYRNSPDLLARLARGEWAALLLGECVGEGFDRKIHVAPSPWAVSADHLLGIGWDGGNTPAAVIGQVVSGQVRIYAALNDMRAGVIELIEQQVIPWLIQHAPWTRMGVAHSTLVHVIDPSLSTPTQITITETPEQVIRQMLGGRMVKGAVRWQPRREAILRVLAPRHEQGHVPLTINPVPETRLLIEALESRWYYPQTPDGRVDRSGPKKPNSPWADVGDAAAYLCGWLWGGDAAPLSTKPVKVESEFALTLGPGASFGREGRA